MGQLPYQKLFPKCPSFAISMARKNVTTPQTNQPVDAPHTRHRYYFFLCRRKHIPCRFLFKKKQKKKTAVENNCAADEKQRGKQTCRVRFPS